MRRGLAGITEKQRQELSVLLNLPRATMHLGDALAPLVRRKLRGIPVDRQLTIATAITNRANDATVRALGDRSADPDRADLEEVLPAVIDAHGIELVRLMVASYAVSDAPCREAMRVAARRRRAVRAPRRSPTTRVSRPTPSSRASASSRAFPRQGRRGPRAGPLREQRKVQKAERRATAAHERAARAAAQAARREALHASKRTGSGSGSGN